MAEAVLFNIASTILVKLGSRALKEIGLLWGLSDELEELQRTVSTIKAVLLDAEKLYRTSSEVKLWLDDLKDVVYDVDDLLDDISTEATRGQLKNGNLAAKKVGLCFSGSNNLEMARKVKDIRAKLSGIAENRRFHLNQNIVESAVVSNDRDTHSSAPSVVIGRDNDKKKIVNLLLSEHTENVAVVPIIGFGGTGKTTLAQIVYNDEKVRAEFELKVWVCVSDIFDVKLIIDKIIGCIDGERPIGNMEMEVLKNRLHDRIKGKKYLLVLDDIWNEDREKWVQLSDVIIGGGARGSRIIVTTRSKVVADVTCTLQPYELEVLSELESWDLFQKVAFEHGKAPNEEFENLGKKIVAKCGGVPLAIRTIGSLLYTKRSVPEWIQFKNGEFSKLDPKTNIVETLKLSYNHLPSNLKQCFAYCSIFPKDYIFDVFTLVEYWRAQGYVDCRTEGISFEDRDLNCVNYLVQRSFFQVEEENKDGEVVKCKMHDFMHDLATSVAGEEVKLLIYDDLNGTSVTGKTRHMSLHEVSSKVRRKHVAPLLQGKKARTLIVRPRTYNRINGDGLLTVLEKLPYVRVLELQNCRFKKFPEFIVRLKHLRQLDLSDNWYIKMLPDAITRLQNLQVLNLDRCRDFRELPKDLKKLTNLTHLGLEECGMLRAMPQGIEKLTSLEVLSRFILSKRKKKHASSGLEELQKLSKLRGRLELVKLQYMKKGVWESEAANLKDKPHLRYLSLDWGKRRESKDMTVETQSLEALQPHVNLLELKVNHYYGTRLPRWVSSLENLVKIEFFDCKECKSLPSLHELPSLQHLKVSMGKLEYLIDNSRVTERSGRPCFFPSLKTLTLSCCFKLKGWWRHMPKTMEEQLQLPCLSTLEIYYCPFDGWMPQLLSLNTLVLHNTGEGLLEETLKQASQPSTSTSTSLSPLQSLSIEGTNNLGSLPEEVLQSLASLKSLKIARMQTKALSPWLQHLTSLKSLSINNCMDVNLLEEKNKESIRCLGKLHYLTISESEGMVPLPKGIQHLTSLDTLTMSSPEEFESFDEWPIDKLNKRCGSNQGEDWPLISYIPNIYVNGTCVQHNGHYWFRRY